MIHSQYCSGTKTNPFGRPMIQLKPTQNTIIALNTGKWTAPCLFSFSVLYVYLQFHDSKTSTSPIIHCMKLQTHSAGSALYKPSPRRYFHKLPQLSTAPTTVTSILVRLPAHPPSPQSIRFPYGAPLEIRAVFIVDCTWPRCNRQH